MKQADRWRRGIGKAVRAASALLLGCLLSVTPCLKAEESKTVLFLEGSEADGGGTAAILDGFRTEIARQWSAPVKASLQPLSSGDTGSTRFNEWLKEKHGKRKVHLIVALEQPPVSLALRYRDLLWRDTPMVIAGIGKARWRELGSPPNTTAVTIDQDIRGTLEAAVRLQPGATTLAFVSLLEYPRLEDRIAWAAEAKAFAEGRMDFVGITGQPLPGLKERLRSLPRGTIVLLRDPVTRSSVPSRMPDVIRELSDDAPGPLFAVTGAYCGEGPVGTSSMDFRQLGRDLARQAVLVFRAPDAREVPAMESRPFVTDYDWRELRRWKLDPALVPAEAVISHRPPGLWEAHRNTMVAVTLAIIGLGSLVAVLLLQRHWRRRSEDALKKQRDQFSQTLRAATVSRLASSLAHELNQPLTALVGNAGAASRYLEREGPGMVKIREILKDIEGDAERAGEIVRSVRSMVCHEERPRSVMEPNEIVAGLRRTLAAEAKSHGCTITETLATGLAPVNVDVIQIQQILLNLAVNAFDAMQLAAPAFRRLEIRTSMGCRGGVCFSIRDSGPGLPPEGGERWFEPFVTTKPGGTGMGLAIARDIAESHGGTLSAEPAEGGGARFVLLLPAFEPTSP